MKKTKSIGEAVKSKRVAAKMTREDLAKELKISTSYVGHVERNSPVRLSDYLVYKIRRKFGNIFTDQQVKRHNTKARKVIRNYPSSKNRD